MPDTPLEKFLKAPFEDQLNLLNDKETSREVKDWLGPDAFDELMKLVPSAAGHLGAGPKNMVFVPGVMGSMLQSEGLGGIWWLDMLRARDRLDGLALTADGQNDADSNADIRPTTVDVTYIPFRTAISNSGSFGGSVQYPYDWRRPIEASAAGLRDAILKCHNDYGLPVHLVGHSMGGLVIRTTLMKFGKELWPKVGKIVFIGTPHYGAPAIAGYLKNHLWGWDELAVLGFYLSRPTLRSMRGVLNLLPAPKDVYPGSHSEGEHPCVNFDLYDANAWKLDNMDAAAIVHLQSVLDETAKFHRNLQQWHQSLLQSYKDRMLMIAGVGYKTLFRLEFDSVFWGMWDKTRKITDRSAGNPHRDGDGRVPLASAQLEDVTLRYVKGVHGGLPNIPAVCLDVLAWLKDDSLGLPDTAGAALGGHLSADQTASPAPHLDGTAVKDEFTDDYDRYTEISEERVKELVKELEAGRLPNINLVRIL